MCEFFYVTNSYLKSHPGLMDSLSHKDIVLQSSLGSTQMFCCAVSPVPTQTEDSLQTPWLSVFDINV